MEKVKLYPLAQRLEWGATGYPCHPEFAPCAIRNMGQTSIPVYLASYDEAQRELAQLLEITVEDLPYLTYAQAARLARGLGQDRAARAAELLALPVLQYNKELEERRAKRERH